MVGIFNNTLGTATPAPPPNTKGCKRWKTDQCKGPIGLLLHQLDTCAAQLDFHLQVHQHNEQPFSIRHLPYNHLKLQVQATHSIARVQAAANTRRLLQHTPAFDSHSTLR